jgi:YVTN family beta-propeller protein
MVGSIPVGGFPAGLAVTPDGSEVYVVNGHSDNVSVIATATNTVVGSPIPVGKFPGPFGVFIQPRFAGTPRYSNCVMARAWRRSPGRLAASVARPQP